MTPRPRGAQCGCSPWLCPGVVFSCLHQLYRCVDPLLAFKGGYLRCFFSYASVYAAFNVIIIFFVRAAFLRSFPAIVCGSIHLFVLFPQFYAGSSFFSRFICVSHLFFVPLHKISERWQNLGIGRNMDEHGAVSASIT